ncbi:MAG: hypothetical protein IT306_18150 [Chloroflexi bacterium]|nr:hypothetical protein [Chloroflexota bacterium]
MIATYYEVWDDATGNRAGGAFDSLEEARALLLDILRLNGEDVAADMAIIAFEPDEAGQVQARTIVEGADFVSEVRRMASTIAHA